MTSVMILKPHVIKTNWILEWLARNPVAMPKKSDSKKIRKPKKK